MSRVLGIAQTKGVLPDEDLDVEIEYEDAAISQYTVASWKVTPEAVVLGLAAKHTDCLGKKAACRRCLWQKVRRLPAGGLAVADA